LVRSLATAHLPSWKDTVRLFAGWRKGAAHGFDFQNAEGRLFARRVNISRWSSFPALMLATTNVSRFFFFGLTFDFAALQASRASQEALPPFGVAPAAARELRRHSGSVHTN
jgi:hypothetical protein